MTSYTPHETATRLLVIDRNLMKEEIKALRRILGRARTKAITIFRQHGLGRGIFGQKAKGARALIKTSKVRIQSQTIRTGLQAIGLAALQETGGRTKKHPIPKSTTNRKRVAFVGRSGKEVVVKQVEHPGSNVKRYPFLEPALASELPNLVAEMEQAALDEWKRQLPG